MLLFSIFKRAREKRRSFGLIISKRFEIVLRRLAGWLQQKFDRLNKKGKIFCFILFCLLFGLGLGRITYRAIHPVRISKIAVVDSSLIGPSPILLHKNKKVPDPLKIRSDILTLQSFLDSLKKDSSGKIIYDSLLSCRPGLFDSLREVKEYLGLQ